MGYSIPNLIQIEEQFDPEKDLFLEFIFAIYLK